MSVCVCGGGPCNGRLTFSKWGRRDGRTDGQTDRNLKNGKILLHGWHKYGVIKRFCMMNQTFYILILWNLNCFFQSSVVHWVLDQTNIFVLSGHLSLCNASFNPAALTLLSAFENETSSPRPVRSCSQSCCPASPLPCSRYL